MLPRIADLVLPQEDGLRLSVEERTLLFRRPARTSRGTLNARTSFYIRAHTEKGCGVGECCPLAGLSPDSAPGYRSELENACRSVAQQGGLLPGDLLEAPSMRMGMECAVLYARFPHYATATPFSRGREGLRIHHLIWMDSAEAQLRQMEQGAEKGFRCLKLKVGHLPWNEELSLLEEARRRFPDCELRVDANGAFSRCEAFVKLEALARIGVACIEQPIRPGQWQALRELSTHSPLPIALDEELLPAHNRDAKERLLDACSPRALVIKPTLHGGLSGAEEWAALAEERGMSWWINSTMESHIAWETLTDWCSLHAPSTMHGLSTGKLFLNDLPCKTALCGERLYRRTDEIARQV